MDKSQRMPQVTPIAAGSAGAGGIVSANALGACSGGEGGGVAATPWATLGNERSRLRRAPLVVRLRPLIGDCGSDSWLWLSWKEADPSASCWVVAEIRRE